MAESLKIPDPPPWVVDHIRWREYWQSILDDYGVEKAHELMTMNDPRTFVKGE